jgi:hypothetical protein
MAATKRTTARRLSTQKSSEAFDGGTLMSKAERIKEEIGWLKVEFAAAVAIDASLIAWLAQNYNTAQAVIVAMAGTAALLLAIFVAHANRVAYRRLKNLEEA